MIGPCAALPWVIVGMAASILSIEGWIEAGVVATAFVLITLWAYPVRPQALLKRIVPFAFFAMITLLFGSLGQGLPRPAGDWDPASATALNRAALAAARLVFLGILASWAGLYVGTGSMMAHLARLGRKIKRIGIDPTPLLLALGIAVRFLPLVQEEARRLHLAWQARGAGLMARRLVGRIRYAAALTVPLLAAALRRAEALAEAVDVRLGGSGMNPGLWAPPPAAREEKEQERLRLRMAVAFVASWLGVLVRVGRWVG